MPRVVYAPEAENDLVEIADHISRDKPQAARRWINNIRETCDTLATQPEAGELRPGFGILGCRSFTVGNFVIFYRPGVDHIEVARIVHASRDMKNL